MLEMVQKFHKLNVGTITINKMITIMVMVTWVVTIRVVTLNSNSSTKTTEVSNSMNTKDVVANRDISSILIIVKIT